MMRGYTSAHPLFDRPATEGPAIKLNSTVEPQDEKRLSAQHVAILDRLREGPATNIELGLICQRFGARLHELKRAGHRIERECVEAGVYRYTLKGGHE